MKNINGNKTTKIRNNIKVFGETNEPMQKECTFLDDELSFDNIFNN